MRKSSKSPKKQRNKQNSGKATNKTDKKQKLNHIVELSEEYETHRNHKNVQAVSLIKKQKKSVIVRSFQCIKRILPCFDPQQQMTFKVNEAQIMKKIQEIRKQNFSKKVALPPLQQKKKTLVIDLDGVLIWSVFQKPQKYDFQIQVPYKDRMLTIYTTVRFGAESFLFQISQLYEIVLYTTRKKPYVDAVLEKLDTKQRINHRLHRDKCIVINKTYNLKNIKILGRQESNIIFVDHDPLTGLLQPNNFYQIRPFSHSEQQDRELLKLMSFLKDLEKRQKVTPIYENFRKFMNKQIELKFIEECKRNSFIKEDKECLQIQNKKRKYGHKKTNSQVESLAAKLDEQDQCHEQSNIEFKTKGDNF